MTMQVVHVTRFGGPEVLVAGAAPEPFAGPGQVVVAVSVAEVLFLDTQLRGGWGGEYFTLVPPYVPGTGVAGTVIGAGEGVDPGLLGRQVIARTGNTGGYAQRAVARADEVFEVPEAVGLREALASLHDGLMALRCVEKARIQPGERVLVGAAGGSLGTWLVPLAHAAGAHVIAAARGERKLELARGLGADVVVDYSEANWLERLTEVIGGAGIDVVFDGTGGPIGRAAFDLTARGGRFFAYGAASGDFAPIHPHEADQRQVTVVGIQDDPLSSGDQRRLTLRALSEIATGRIRPVIGHTFPLEHATAAHTAIEARDVIGKTLLLVAAS
jgi:NADPH:quinone reductase